MQSGIFYISRYEIFNPLTLLNILFELVFIKNCIYCYKLGKNSDVFIREVFK